MKSPSVQLWIILICLLGVSFVWADPPPFGRHKKGKGYDGYDNQDYREYHDNDMARHNRPAVASEPLPPGTRPFPLTLPSQFPVPNLPTDNPLSMEGVALGQKLFIDPILSVNRRQACSSCHQANAGFVDRGRKFSLGAEGTMGTRNAMPLFNLAWKDDFFWDGRAHSLREQVLMPMQNPIEMHETLPRVVNKLSVTTNYPALFTEAFGSPGITSDRIARALEQFLLTLISAESKFDRYRRGELQLTSEERRGYQIFVGNDNPRRGQAGGSCAHCHGGPLFSSLRFANNGLDSSPKDLGRYLTTHQERDKGRFAVPSLRNIELTAPYMHDGRFKSLEEVVDHYSSGIKTSVTLDRGLARHGGGLALSGADKKALVAFMKTLTDDRFRSAIPQVASTN